MTSGGSHEAGRPPMRRGIRIAVVFLALAALTVPMAYVFTNLWSVTSAQVSDLTAEQRGVRYLGPLTHLVGVISETESATLNGKSADAEKVRSAMAKVDAVDRADGAALGANERWAKLRKEIDATLKAKPTGHTAYHAYADLNTPALALVAKIGETSSLGTDRELVAHSTLLRMPAVIVASGQVADLLRPADTGPRGGTPPKQDDGHGGHGKESSSKGNDHAGETSAAPAGRVAVALDRLSSGREAIRDGLQRNGGAMVEGARALDALDELSAAIVALIEAAKPAAEAEKPALDDADDAAERVRKAALLLTDQMLESLDAQLADRLDELTGNRLAAGIAMVLGVVLAAVLLWLSLPGPGERWPERASGPAVPDFDRPTAGDRPDPMPAPELIDARELLSHEELLRVGRAVRATRGEPEDGSH